MSAVAGMLHIEGTIDTIYHRQAGDMSVDNLV